MHVLPSWGMSFIHHMMVSMTSTITPKHPRPRVKRGQQAPWGPCSYLLFCRRLLWLARTAWTCCRMWPLRSWGGPWLERYRFLHFFTFWSSIINWGSKTDYFGVDKYIMFTIVRLGTTPFSCYTVLCHKKTSISENRVKPRPEEEINSIKSEFLLNWSCSQLIFFKPRSKFFDSNSLFDSALLKLFSLKNINTYGNIL